MTTEAPYVTHAKKALHLLRSGESTAAVLSEMRVEMRAAVLDVRERPSLNDWYLLGVVFDVLAFTPPERISSKGAEEIARALDLVVRSEVTASEYSEAVDRFEVAGMLTFPDEGEERSSDPQL